MPAPMIGIVAHVGKPGVTQVLETLNREFTARGAHLLFESATAKLIGRDSSLTVASLGEQSEMLVVLGGDGTILQVLHELGDAIKPIFGINLGSLGFLTCVSSSAHQEAVEAITSGQYVLSPRTLLDVEIVRAGSTLVRRTGLNDMVISRGSLSRLIKLETRIDGAFLTEYNADGLIISTPTGSTAYSLAAGGPILTPGSGVFLVTPICPHVLTNRSVIVPETSLIEVRPCHEESAVYLTVDGQEAYPTEQGDVVRIRKSNRQLPLAMLPETTYFEVLRQKLKWGGSAL